MTIRTALLEARFLLGDKKLFDEMMARFDKQVVQGTGPDFVAAKLAEREERHRRGGQSRYLVEPNVKDGKGGLRDLHTLFWIAKYVYRVRELEELADRGVFEQEELRLFRRCEDFLWSVRCNMHFVAGRAEERLSFDIQREIAIRLGYTEHPGMKDVERFMKHYFLVAKDVGDLTAILCSALEDQQAKPAPVLSRMIAKFRPRGRRALPDAEGFLDDNNRLTIAGPEVFTQDPVNLIRMFRIAQKHNLVLHPDAMRAATKSLRLIDSEAPAESRSQQAVPGNPHLARRRDHPAPDERDRRARPLRSRVRPHRRDDAVQHVPPLHGGRASARAASACSPRSSAAPTRSSRSPTT